MKKSQVNELLINETKKKRKIIFLIFTIINFLLISFFFLLIYLEKSKEQYVKYVESGDVDYNIYIIENNFFKEDHLKSDKGYIANLIDYIEANFDYNISLDEKDINFKYNYKIEANVKIKEKNGNIELYNFSEDLINIDEKISSSNHLNLNEKVKIDYTKYNGLAKEFVNTFKLDNIESILYINMYINVVGTCEDFEENATSNSVISLEVPLTTKTVTVDTVNNLLDTTDNVMICNQKYSITYFFLIVSILFVILSLLVIIYLIKYIISSRSPEDIYELKLKSILNKYHSYIQKVNNSLDLINNENIFIDDKVSFKNYQIFKIDTFTDMLEIRDTLNKPILMIENKDKKAAYFIVITNKIIYIYSINIKNLEQ